MNVKRKNSNDGKDGMGEGRGKGKEEKRQTKWRESRPDQFLVVVTAAERSLNTALSVRRCAAQCGLVWGSLFPTGTSAAELVAGRLGRGVRYGIRNVFVSQTGWLKVKPDGAVTV